MDSVINDIIVESKEHQQRETDSRRFKSEQHKKYIGSQAESARPHWFWNPNIEELKAMGNTLKWVRFLLPAPLIARDRHAADPFMRSIKTGNCPG